MSRGWGRIGPVVLKRGPVWPGGIFYFGLSSAQGPTPIEVFNERDNETSEVDSFLHVTLLAGPRLEWDLLPALHLGATLEYRFTFPDVHTGERGMSPTL